MALRNAVPLSSLLSPSFILLKEIAVFRISRHIWSHLVHLRPVLSCLAALYPHPPVGPTSISVTLNGKFMVHILLREVESGRKQDSPLEDLQRLCKKYSTFSSTSKFCPGIAVRKYDELMAK